MYLSLLAQLARVVGEEIDAYRHYATDRTAWDNYNQLMNTVQRDHRYKEYGVTITPPSDWLAAQQRHSR